MLTTPLTIFHSPFLLLPDENLAGVPIAAQCGILPLSPPVARTAGLLRGGFAAQGSARSAADMQIAATALTYRLELATRNTPDFEGCGLNLLHPFS